MLDTNIILDWLLNRDPKRTAAVQALFERSNQLHVPDIVIFETVFVLEGTYGFDRDVIVANIHTLLDQQNINCNRQLFSRATTDYLNHPTWSFVDACLLTYSRLQNADSVWTFDKKLVSQSDGRAKLPV